MELVRVAVKRRSTDDSSELNINVETTPIGSLLAGATVVWIGAKLLRAVQRRWWLPIGVAAAVLFIRQLSAARSASEQEDEEADTPS